jgi:hypothetical protein
MHGEQRKNGRTPVSVPIVINFDATYSKLWETRDMGLDGAYAERGRIDLPYGAHVEVALLLKENNKFIKRRLPAKVVRVEESGIALEFGRYDEDIYSDIVHFLHRRYF